MGADLCIKLFCSIMQSFIFYPFVFNPFDFLFSFPLLPILIIPFSLLSYHQGGWDRGWKEWEVERDMCMHTHTHTHTHKQTYTCTLLLNTFKIQWDNMPWFLLSFPYFVLFLLPQMCTFVMSLSCFVLYCVT